MDTRASKERRGAQPGSGLWPPGGRGDAHAGELLRVDGGEASEGGEGGQQHGGGVAAGLVRVGEPVHQRVEGHLGGPLGLGGGGGGGGGRGVVRQVRQRGGVCR